MPFGAWGGEGRWGWFFPGISPRELSRSPPPVAPRPGSYHENPRSCAGALWRASMVLFAGEGVPSPSPSPGDISHGTVCGMMPAKRTIRPAFRAGLSRGYPLRYGVWDDACGGRNQGRHPGPAFLVLAPLLGISRLLPPPTGAGEERQRRGRGGGDRRAVHGEMPAEGGIGAGIPGRPFRGDRRAVYGERPAKHTLRTGPPGLTPSPPSCHENPPA